ncbi:MAG: tripartite tricarboxylate transporter substrate binding protein [Burkholderiales bacterium]
MIRTLLGALFPALAALCATVAVAQSYPSQPIKFIVPYPPGGNTDIVARLYAQKLAERLGQPVVIDNRGGAAGSLGMGIAAKAANDGYTIVIGDLGSLVIGPLAKPGVGYDPQKDFAPVSVVSAVSIVVTANPKSGINSMQDLLARAKAQPGKLNAGTGGQAGPGHLALELLRTMGGVDIVHVPFKGGAAATTALLGEQVDIVIDGSAMAQVKGGKLKAIAVTGPRLPALPDVPGIGETVKGYEFTNWWGILAPAGTPAAVVARLNQELTAIAAMPDVREKLSDLGLAAQSSTPQQFADLIRTEMDKIAKIVKDAAIKFE